MANPLALKALQDRFRDSPWSEQMETFKIAGFKINWLDFSTLPACWVTYLSCGGQLMNIYPYNDYEDARAFIEYLSSKEYRKPGDERQSFVVFDKNGWETGSGGPYEGQTVLRKHAGNWLARYLKQDEKES